MINRMSLLHFHFQRFGLLMHIGTRATPSFKGSKSKIKAMYFPSKQLKVIPSDELAANKADFNLTSQVHICPKGARKLNVKYLQERFISLLPLAVMVQGDSASACSLGYEPKYVSS